MRIHHAIWKVEGQPAPLTVTKLPSERELEDMITARPEILSVEWMLLEAAGAARIQASGSCQNNRCTCL